MARAIPGVANLILVLLAGGRALFTRKTFEETGVRPVPGGENPDAR